MNNDQTAMKDVFLRLIDTDIPIIRFLILSSSSRKWKSINNMETFLTTEKRDFSSKINEFRYSEHYEIFKSNCTRDRHENGEWV